LLAGKKFARTSLLICCKTFSVCFCIDGRRTGPPTSLASTIDLDNKNGGWHPEQATRGTGGAKNCPQPRSPTGGLSVNNLLALIIFNIGIDQNFLTALII
jgi:hypothetical protein